MRVLNTINDLKPAPYNPRKISVEAAAGLGYSLERFGDLSGIVWNAQTGHLVCGHQRLEELRRRGVELVERDLVLPDGQRFPVRVVDWPEHEEQLANVTANNQRIAGEFTADLGKVLEAAQAVVGDEVLESLRLDGLAKPLSLPDIGCLAAGGDVNTEERKRYAVLVPECLIGEIKALAEKKGGSVVCCDDQDCDLGVRRLDTNSWAERRAKLAPSKTEKHRDQDSGSQDCD